MKCDCCGELKTKVVPLDKVTWICVECARDLIQGLVTKLVALGESNEKSVQ